MTCERELNDFCRCSIYELGSAKKWSEEKIDQLIQDASPYIINEGLERDIKKVIRNYYFDNVAVRGLRYGNARLWDEWHKKLSRSAKQAWLQGKKKEPLSESNIEEIVNMAVSMGRRKMPRYDFNLRLSTWFFDIVIERKKAWYELRDLKQNSRPVKIKWMEVESKEQVSAAEECELSPSEELLSLCLCYMSSIRATRHLPQEEARSIAESVLPYLKVADERVKNIAENYEKDGAYLKQLMENNMKEWRVFQVSWTKRISERYQDPIVRYNRTIGSAHEVAGELLSRLMINDNRALRNFRFEAALDTYLWVIVDSVINRLTREQCPREIRLCSTEEQESEGNEIPDPDDFKPEEEILIREAEQERRKLVEEEIEKIANNPINQFILRMIFLEEEEYGVIANRLMEKGQPKTVNALSRIAWTAREKLRADCEFKRRLADHLSESVRDQMLSIEDAIAFYKRIFERKERDKSQ